MQRAQIENALAAVPAAHIHRISALMPETNLFQAAMAQLLPTLEQFGSAFEACLPVNWPRSRVWISAMPSRLWMRGYRSSGCCGRNSWLS